ncbi:MAG: two-component system, cell cycle sensor histidine kinase and response regulator CckA [Solirubrobacteraceae bacterium]|nr:two-component system, cell cycle sensor histidine kinase and response regulator CckA [Solirubrobacteraceae bacterium]
MRAGRRGDQSEQVDNDGDHGGNDSAPLDNWATRVIEASLDAVITIDATGRVVQFNAAAEQMFGYTRDEALGQSLATLIIPPDLQAAHWAGLLRVVAGEQPRILDRRLELRAMRRGGDEIPVEVTVTRVSESPLLFSGFIRDLSDLRDAEHRGSHMERVLATAEQLVHMGSWDLDLRTGDAVWSEELYRIHGFEPGSVEPGVDMLVALVHADDRDWVRSMLETVTTHPDRVPPEGATFDYRIVRADGSVRAVRAHGRIELDRHGKPWRWVGSAQDVTDQRLTERELHAHYAVEQALRDWETFEEGVVGLLRRLGTALDFAMGSLWICDRETDALTCRAFWSAPGVDAGEFELVTRSLTFRRGEGVPGTAWDTQQPVIAPDLATAPRFRRAKVAERLGLRSGLAFPVVADDGPLAVLSFYSLDRRDPGERLARTLTGIGRELGRFLAHRRADLGTRRLSDRELDVLRLAAEGNTGPQIAEHLILSPATVKTHFENIYEKLGVSDRAAAVAHAMRIGLIR